MWSFCVIISFAKWSQFQWIQRLNSKWTGGKYWLSIGIWSGPKDLVYSRTLTGKNGKKSSICVKSYMMPIRYTHEYYICCKNVQSDEKYYIIIWYTNIVSPYQMIWIIVLPL